MSSTANSFCARTTVKKEAASYQRLIRIQKRTSWKSFCSNEMNRDLFTSLHYLAKRSKLTSDAPTRLLVNGITITSPVEIAKAFANHFFKPPIPSSESHNQIVLANDYFLHSAPSTHIPPITYLELESAISTLKQTNSAGTDLLSASFISASYDCYPPILLDILNNALANGWYPIPWKTAKITIIQKPNKTNYELLENYRPISVIPTFSKIFERIMLSRLKWHAVEEKWFNEGQHGFREGYSTESAIHYLVHHIESHFSKKEFTACAFIDIKSAFDSA